MIFIRFLVILWSFRASRSVFESKREQSLTVLPLVSVDYQIREGEKGCGFGWVSVVKWSCHPIKLCNSREEIVTQSLKWDFWAFFLFFKEIQCWVSDFDLCSYYCNDSRHCGRYRRVQIRSSHLIGGAGAAADELSVSVNRFTVRNNLPLDKLKTFCFNVSGKWTKAKLQLSQHLWRHHFV